MRDVPVVLLLERREDPRCGQFDFAVDFGIVVRQRLSAPHQFVLFLRGPDLEAGVADPGAAELGQSLTSDQFLVDRLFRSVDYGELVRYLSVSGEPGRGQFMAELVHGFAQREVVLRLQQRFQPRRYQATDDHVLLETAQPVPVAGNRRHGEDLRRFLEGRLGEEAVRGKRGFGHAEQQRLRRRRLATLGQHLGVLVLEPELVHNVPGDELGVTGGLDLHPPQHLPEDDLDVLVVDAHSLGPVDLLNLVNQVMLQPFQAADVQQFTEIQRSVHQRVAGHHLLIVSDFQDHL